MNDLIRSDNINYDRYLDENWYLDRNIDRNNLNHSLTDISVEDRN
jgi:predicted metal-dependent hydrolase